MIFPMFLMRLAMVFGVWMFMVGQGMGPLWASSKGALHDDPPPPPYQPPVVRPSAPPMPKKLDDEGERKAAVKEFVLKSDADQMRTLAAVRNMATPRPPIHIKVEYAANLKVLIDCLHALADIIKPTPPRVKSFDEGDAKIDYDFIPQLSFDPGPDTDIYGPYNADLAEVTQLLDKGIYMSSIKVLPFQKAWQNKKGWSIASRGCIGFGYLEQPYFKHIIIPTSFVNETHYEERGNIDDFYLEYIKDDKNIFYYLEKHIIHNRWLERLNIKAPIKDDHTANRLSLALLSNQKLRKLELDLPSWTALGKCYASIFAALESHPTLKRLNIFGVGNKEAVASLAALVQGTSRLKTLQISMDESSNNWVDVTPLGEAIAQNTTLVSVFFNPKKALNENRPGITALIKGINKNTSIVYFNGKDLNRPLELPAPPKPVVMPAPAAAPAPRPPVVAPAAPKASSQAANDGCCTIH